MTFASMWQDLRHGVRMFAKNPGFTLVAVVSIGIGVGVNTAMFSVADGLLLRPLQVPRADEIVVVNAVAPRPGASFIANTQLSYPDYADLRDRSRSFKGLLAHDTIATSFAARHGEPAQVTLGLAVSGNFFDVLELRPALGRFFLPEEDRVPGRDAVIVLAHDVWADRFASDPAILGQLVQVGGMSFTVVGVAPQRFAGMHLALPPAFYVPLAISASLPGPRDLLDRRDVRVLDVKGRLAPGVSFEQARQEAAVIGRSLEQSYPGTNQNYGLLVRTHFEARLEERGPSAPTAFMLLALAFVVLLVACANVAGLLLSRAPVRAREIALRVAIGGSRVRVTRQLMTEAVLLAMGGGALGLALGYGGILLLRRLPIVSDIGVRLTFDLDRRVLAVGLVLAALSALLSSVVPAWRATHIRSLARALKGDVSTGRFSHLWGRNGLVAGQVALSLMLLTVTLSLFQAVRAELGRPGFRTDRMLLSNFEPRLAGYDSARTEAYYRLLKERVQGLPGVVSVGMTSVMPLNQDWREPVAIIPEGYQLPPGTESLTVLTARIDDGYLDTMGIPVVRGRGIQRADDANAPRVVLINEAMAARYWPGQDPLGRRIRLPGRDGQPWAEVVGVTADSKYNWIGEPPTPWMYVAERQDPGVRSTLLVASRGDAAPLAAPLREIVRDLDPNMPIAGLRTMEEFYYGNAVGLVYGLVAVTIGMGLAGLALAMVGLYGLVAYAVGRRTREIGIRIAVGARPGSVRRMVLRHGLGLAAAGAAIGVIGSFAASGLLSRVIANAGGIDTSIYLVVVLLLAAVTLLAACVPARRASRIDPLVALREE